MPRKTIIYSALALGVAFIAVIGGSLLQNFENEGNFYTREELIQQKKSFNYIPVREPDITGPHRQCNPPLRFNAGTPAMGSYTLKNGDRREFFFEAQDNQELLFVPIENQKDERDYFLFARIREK